MESLPQLDSVAAAVAKLAERLQCVGSEVLSTAQASGRVLAEPLHADRDSPAIDVSAMDGYAVRLSDLERSATLPVASTIAAGAAPVALPAQSAVRIFTGASVPSEADCVVRHEDTREEGDTMQLVVPLESLRTGQNIRRKGENTRQDDVVLPEGTLLTPSAFSAVATFARGQLVVRKRIRVAVLNTGDELAAIGQAVSPWQIRDSNGPMLEAWLRQLPWVEFVDRKHVGDTLRAVCTAIEQSLGEADATILTGGVSMGDADFVPEAITKLGGEIAFHRLPIRPGKPVLGASLEGKLLLGLPGNPVSVAVTSRVIGLPLLRRLAGFATIEGTTLQCSVANPDSKTLGLIWYRLVQVQSDSTVKLVESQGSGDLVSLAKSDGFIEQPMGASGSGPWKLRSW